MEIKKTSNNQIKEKKERVRNNESTRSDILVIYTLT